jgi:hypothetical protein
MIPITRLRPSSSLLFARRYTVHRPEVCAMANLRLILLRWKIKAHAWLESVWEGRWCGIVLTVGAATIACAVLFYRVPPPGVSVAVMGVTAAIMAARTKATGAEKATWMLIISSLLVAEILAIHKDRQLHDAELANLFRQGTSIKSQAETKFGELGGKLQGQIDTTNTILDKTKAVMGLSQQSLQNITGGDSFAVVTPQVWSGLVPIPLSIYNYGKQTLTGVTVTIRDREAWDFWRNPYSMYQAEASAISVGTLHAGELKVLAKTLTPSVEENGAGIVGEGKDKACQYQLDISAQNFTATETLVFKKGKKLPWVFRYVVTRQFVKSQVKGTTNFGYKTLAETKKWMGED